MSIYDDLILILGGDIGEYPFLVAFACVVVFLVLIFLLVSIFADIFKYVGGR